MKSIVVYGYYFEPVEQAELNRSLRLRLVSSHPLRSAASQTPSSLHLGAPSPVHCESCVHFWQIPLSSLQTRPSSQSLIDKHETQAPALQKGESVVWHSLSAVHARQDPAKQMGALKSVHSLLAAQARQLPAEQMGALESVQRSLELHGWQDPAMQKEAAASVH